MVASYSTLAHEGRYIPPVLITRVDDRNGKVLETFADPVAETAMLVGAANMLLDVMRGVVDIGTGAGIRSRYSIRADVAGKTGTTQNNTDGWFILVHPQLVAGAWAGFNDNRVTMGDRWGPGAQSALPMVGTFFQQAIKAKLIDAKQQFSAPRDPSALQAAPLVPLESVDPGAPAQPVTPSADTPPENYRGGRNDIPNDLATVVISPVPSQSPQLSQPPRDTP